VRCFCCESGRMGGSGSVLVWLMRYPGPDRFGCWGRVSWIRFDGWGLDCDVICFCSCLGDLFPCVCDGELDVELRGRF